MRYNFVLPNNFNTPIGGYKIVYEYANSLVDEGNEVYITFMLYDATPFSYDTIVGLLKKTKILVLYLLGIVYTSEKIVDWFKLDDRIKIKFGLPYNFCFVNSDFIIATAWQTAYSVRKINKRKGCKYYLLQHNEQVFGPQSLVEKTWFFPLKKIAVASWIKNLVEKKTYQPVKLVKNFVNLNDFYITSSLDKRKKVISMLYHENAAKGSKDGIEVIKKVHEYFPDLKVELFGTVNIPENLPDYCNYTRNANTEQLRNIYNKSIIYLFPSHSEGWGLTATEAMACGATLISTKNGGVNDFGIDGETALLSEVGDISKLSNDIIYLFNNPNMRQSLAQNGVLLVQQLTKEKSFKKLKEFLQV